MALPILTALRALRDPHLKESLLHTAQELAHRASIYGVARVSLSYLALKCHCCKQTIINHLKKLIELKIISKTVIWMKGNYCEVNTYRFLLSWDKAPAQQGGSQNSGPKFPPHEEGEKSEGLAEKIRQLEKGLQLCTEGAVAYEATQERLAQLRACAAGAMPYERARAR
jgi:hypothetical protein